DVDVPIRIDADARGYEQPIVAHRPRPRAGENAAADAEGRDLARLVLAGDVIDDDLMPLAGIRDDEPAVRVDRQRAGGDSVELSPRGRAVERVLGRADPECAGGGERDALGRG